MVAAYQLSILPSSINYQRIFTSSVVSISAAMVRSISVAVRERTLLFIGVVMSIDHSTCRNFSYSYREECD